MKKKINKIDDIDQNPQVKNKEKWDIKKINSTDNLINISNVSVIKYSSDINRSNSTDSYFKILDSITWKINQFQHYALIGPNGSGKTTILKIILGEIWPNSGDIAVFGKKYGTTDLRVLRQNIGYVSSYLFEKIPKQDKILNIIISGKYSSYGLYTDFTQDDIEYANSLLILLGCQELKNKAYQILSQGEKQKILIARALMAKPKLLILDEPCTGLDIRSKRKFLETISDICNQKACTILYVTHHIDEIVQEIQHILVLKDGCVFKNMSRQELNLENLIYELYGIK